MQETGWDVPFRRANVIKLLLSREIEECYILMHEEGPSMSDTPLGLLW